LKGQGCRAAALQVTLIGHHRRTSCSSGGFNRGEVVTLYEAVLGGRFACRRSTVQWTSPFPWNKLRRTLVEGKGLPGKDGAGVSIDDPISCPRQRHRPRS
jgi:hypothetical protein